MVLQDITSDEILSNIKDQLIQKEALQTPKSVSSLQNSLRRYLSIPDLKFGFTLFDAKDGQIDTIGWKNKNSLVLHNDDICSCDKDLYCEGSYDMVFNSGEPVSRPLISSDAIKLKCFFNSFSLTFSSAAFGIDCPKKTAIKNNDTNNFIDNLMILE